MDHRGRPSKRKGWIGSLVVAAIVLFVLDVMRVHVVTHDGKFSAQPACASIVAGELTKLLPAAVSTSSCAWKSPGVGAGAWTLTMTPGRYTRQVSLTKGRSGAQVAHLVMGRVRHALSGPVEDVSGIGGEAFQVTHGTAYVGEATLYFRVSNLIVELMYFRTAKGVDRDDVLHALEDSASRMAASLA